MPESLAILLVEDHHDVAEVMLLLLESLGYRPTHAASVEEALRAVENESFAALLVDFRLPDGNGRAILDALPEHQQRRAILLSAYDPATLPPEETAGFTRVLRKPVDVPLLQRTIEDVANV